MFFYLNEPLYDKRAYGSIELTAEQKVELGTTSRYIRYLGKGEDGKYIYTNSNSESIPDPVLDSLPRVADRIDELQAFPYINNGAAKIGEIADFLRTFVPPPVEAPLPAMKTLGAFNKGVTANGAAWFGASIGSGINGSGWPEYEKHVVPMIALGVKAIRFPFKREYCFNADGSINVWVLNRIVDISKRCALAGVAAVWDDHSYDFFTDKTVTDAWVILANAIENGTGIVNTQYPHTEKGLGGPSQMFAIELANEPGKGSKDLTLWTEPLAKTIRAIRVGGYQGYILAGAPDWNNMVYLATALTAVEAFGGVTKMDPFNRTIYTGHDYWQKDADSSKTRNDLGVAVDGNMVIANRYNATVVVARRIGAKILMSEIGGGYNQSGPMPAYNGVGKTGGQLQDEYYAWADANADVLLGTLFWMGGKTSVDYQHKIAAGLPGTVSMQTFW